VVNAHSSGLREFAEQDVASKKRYLVFMAMFAMNMLNYADRINLSMAASNIASTFDLSPIEMGYMFSSFLWTYLICLIPAGLAVDSLGARKVTAIAMIVWSVGGLVSGLASSFLLLLGARLILGIGESRNGLQQTNVALRLPC
jgi:MFS family permease